MSFIRKGDLLYRREQERLDKLTKLQEMNLTNYIAAVLLTASILVGESLAYKYRSDLPNTKPVDLYTLQNGLNVNTRNMEQLGRIPLSDITPKLLMKIVKMMDKKVDIHNIISSEGFIRHNVQVPNAPDSHADKGLHSFAKKRTSNAIYFLGSICKCRGRYSRKGSPKICIVFCYRRY